MRSTPLLASLAAAILAAPALAQPVPDYDFEWSTIGDPGNRNATPDEAPRLFPPISQIPTEVGAVDYEYRMARTEVTVAQWLEFIDIAWKYEPGRIDLFEFTTFWITVNNPNPGPGETPGFELAFPEAANFPANVSWYNAAKYVNWLHNGKIDSNAALQSGAYDTSTFGGVDANGNPTDQYERSPGATFWIPSRDEWIKGMHWDPDKDGEGGYWLMPDGGDEPLISLPPDQGGETNAGPFFNALSFDEGLQYRSVGMYPDTQSPWGLLDGSGGLSEMTETRTLDQFLDWRMLMSSEFGTRSHEFRDPSMLLAQRFQTPQAMDSA